MSSKPLFHRITIVGVGLLGGSIGLAAKKLGVAREVVGHFRNPKKIAPAVRRGAIDRGTTDLREAIRESDLIVLATPINDIVAKIKTLRAWKIKTLVTDTGSTKSQIVRSAAGLCFVGSHPIAGSEQSGIAFARPDLFKNSLCILTPGPAPATASHRVTVFWKSLGAAVKTMRPAVHDRTLGFTSHLPHAVAFALMNTIQTKDLAFAGGGLKDTTRIAASHPGLWSEILLSNKKEVQKAIRRFSANLNRIHRDLSRRPDSLRRTLSAAQKKRTRWTNAA